jgi:uroporphyrinogen-III synthase
MPMSKQSIANAVPVLLTRSELQSLAFATTLTKRFGGTVRPLVTPLMAPRFLTPEVPKEDFVAAIFTSVWAVASAAQLGVALPRRAYCVGRKTAAVAEAAGFHAISADGDANALVSAILADRPDGRLLHFRGVNATGEVGERLNSAGIETISLVVYRQEPQPLGADGVELLRMQGDVIVPLFSPHSSVLFLKSLPPDARASLYLAAISAQVADAAATIPCVAMVIAERPDGESMLQAIGKLLATVSPP